MLNQVPSPTIAALGCVLITAGFALIFPDVQYWFVLPALACGIITGTDAVDWLRGRLSLMDPAGLLGLFGVHFFFLAPMLHVARDWWMIDIPIAQHPLDWRPWLGWMACLNLTGLIVYRLSLPWFQRNLPFHANATWTIEPRRFWPGVLIVLLAAGILQTWVYVKFGGIAGYLHTILDLRDAEAVQGLGWVFTLCELFPTFAIMAWAVATRSHPALKSWGAIAAMLICFFAILMLFGGLRGSRGNTIWGLIGAVGVVHLLVRPINRRTLVCGGALALLFLYLYGFVKGAGTEGIDAIFDPTLREEIAQKTGRTMDTMVLGDLGRSDVQAFLLYRLSQRDSDFQHSFGRTYLGAVASVVPSALWPDKPPTKVLEGTDAQWGSGSYELDGIRSSRQYGIAGEALLNFGIWSIPLAFAFLGFAVAAVRLLMARLDPADVRLIFLPSLSLCCFLLLVMDLDNILLFLLKSVLIPIVVLPALIQVQPSRRAAPPQALSR